MTPLSRIIPYLCGLSKEARRDRRLCMFRTFIDESGADARDPVVVAGGLVGSVDNWEKLSDEWQTAMEAQNPKPLKTVNGQIYFKHSEARAREGCFDGFTDKEAEEKTIRLAEVITRHDIGVMGWVVYRDMYDRIVDEMVVKKSGKLYNDYAKDPLYMCVHHLVGLTLGIQHVKNPTDNVDFILDDGPISKRVISMYEFIRENMPGMLLPIMGTMVPMDDKKVLPLQAADLLAGQIRMATQYGGVPIPLYTLKQASSTYWVEPLHEKMIRIFLSMINVSASTRSLTKIKKELNETKTDD